MRKKLDTLQSWFASKADLYCLVETWLTEHRSETDIPGYTVTLCLDLWHSEDLSEVAYVYVAERLSKHVNDWKVAADNSYLWLHFPHVTVDGRELYFCICYMAPCSSTANADSNPYDALQLDIVDAQNAGGCIAVCGDMNARTAEEEDHMQLADLQDFVGGLPDEEAYLDKDIPR